MTTEDNRTVGQIILQDLDVERKWRAIEYLFKLVEDRADIATHVEGIVSCLTGIGDIDLGIGVLAALGRKDERIMEQLIDSYKKTKSTSLKIRLLTVLEEIDHEKTREAIPEGDLLKVEMEKCTMEMDVKEAIMEWEKNQKYDMLGFETEAALGITLLKLGKDAVPKILEYMKVDRGIIDRKPVAKIAKMLGISREQIEELIGIVRTGDFSDIAGPAVVLGQLKEVSAVRPLMERESVDCLDALGEIGDYRAIGLLIRIIDPAIDYGRQVIAMEALKNIIMQNHDLDLRIIKRIFEAVLPSTNDFDFDVRTASMELLTVMDNGECIPILIEALKDESKVVRETAYRGVATYAGGKLGVDMKRVIGVLEEFVERESKKGDKAREAAVREAMGYYRGINERIRRRIKLIGGAVERLTGNMGEEKSGLSDKTVKPPIGTKGKLVRVQRRVTT